MRIRIHHRPNWGLPFTCPLDLKEYLYNQLKEKRDSGRFDFKWEGTTTARAHIIRIGNVKLKKPKPYCSAQPGPCWQRSLHTHCWYNHLEGADWVGFNDGINDILDGMNVQANVRQGAVLIRLAGLRRVRYGADKEEGFPQQWWQKRGDLNSDFMDCRHLATTPRAWFPEGTRGFPVWKEREIDYSRLVPIVTTFSGSGGGMTVNFLEKEDYLNPAKHILRIERDLRREGGFWRGLMVSIHGDAVPAGLVSLLTKSGSDRPFHQHVEGTRRIRLDP